MAKLLGQGERFMGVLRRLVRISKIPDYALRRPGEITPVS
jgi:hypothetical protein